MNVHGFRDYNGNGNNRPNQNVNPSLSDTIPFLSTQQ